MQVIPKEYKQLLGTILLTPNERRVAEDRPDCYSLYVVTNCASTPELPGAGQKSRLVPMAYKHQGPALLVGGERPDQAYASAGTSIKVQWATMITRKSNEQQSENQETPPAKLEKFSRCRGCHRRSCLSRRAQRVGEIQFPRCFPVPA